MRTLLKLIPAISLLTALFIAGGIIWKAEESGSAVGRNRAGLIEGNIELTISVPKTEFARGENIDMSLLVKNHRNENVTFTFSSGYQHDFVVYDENFSKVCAWSDDKAYIQAFTHLTLEPKESRNWNWNWNQMVYNRSTGEYSPIGSGTYHLRGILVGYLETPLLKITIF